MNDKKYNRAIDTMIMRYMESTDERKKVFIFAGYPDPMRELMVTPSSLHTHTTHNTRHTTHDTRHTTHNSQSSIHTRTHGKTSTNLKL
jgi:GrpB-like predicted nucleotidyltransferase (UPF0157 family)